LNAGLPLITSRRVSESLFTLDLPSGTIPEALNERIADMLRDFSFEVKEGVRSQVLALTREIPTVISLTSMRVPPPQQAGGAGPAVGEAPRPPEQLEAAWNPELEEHKIQRAVSRDVEARLRNLLINYRNVELIGEPLSAAEVVGAMKRMLEIAGPMSAPLSEVERKDHQRRAIEALWQLAPSRATTVGRRCPKSSTRCAPTNWPRRRSRPPAASPARSRSNGLVKSSLTLPGRPTFAIWPPMN
jgi:hypothetical protein